MKAGTPKLLGILKTLAFRPVVLIMNLLKIRTTPALTFEFLLHFNLPCGYSTAFSNCSSLPVDSFDRIRHMDIRIHYPAMKLEIIDEFYSLA
jgi:hypothetical protein